MSVVSGEDDPFAAANGFTFGVDSEEFMLETGRYPTGNGAIHVHCVTGEPECSLTVNIVELNGSLQPHEFFVRRQSIENSPTPLALLATGLFARTREVVSQGYVEEYAERWCFVPCHCGVSTPDRSPKFAICCADCRKRATR